MMARYNFAKEIIRETGAFLRQAMTEPFAVETKSDFTDLVTDLDKKIQMMLMTAISEAYPASRFLAEEGDVVTDIEQGQVWVIDPIDGTNNFVAQGCDFAIVLAYYEDGVGQFGLIYDVMADDLYHGGPEFGVYRNETALLPYQERPLNQSLLALNPGMYVNNTNGIAHLAKAVLGIRTYGSAAISMAKVLSGQLLGYVSHLSPWDYAVAKIMGETLGYVTLTLEGKSLNFKEREHVMMVPKCQLSQIKTIMEQV